jgi:hypothetical protein
MGCSLPFERLPARSDLRCSSTRCLPKFSLALHQLRATRSFFNEWPSLRGPPGGVGGRPTRQARCSSLKPNPPRLLRWATRFGCRATFGSRVPFLRTEQSVRPNRRFKSMAPKTGVWGWIMPRRIGRPFHAVRVPLRPNSSARTHTPRGARPCSQCRGPCLLRRAASGVDAGRGPMPQTYARCVRQSRKVRLIGTPSPFC